MPEARVDGEAVQGQVEQVLWETAADSRKKDRREPMRRFLPPYPVDYILGNE